MTVYQIAPRGGPVDVACHKGQVVIVWQDGPGPDAQLVQRTYTPRGVLIASVTYPLGSDVGAFPRLLSAHGSLWLLYRVGASLGGTAILRRDGVVIWTSPVASGGNDCVCLGFAEGEGVAAWQRAGDNRAEVFYVATLVARERGDGRPTGLSHFTAHGDLVLVDDARGAVPGMTRPSWAGALVAGEHPDAGVLVRHTDGRELLACAGQEAVAPRLAHDAQTGLYAVVTSGVRHGIDYGVRWASFTEADLAAPPSETWDVPGTVVDCGRFFNVLGSTVPREASDGQCWQAHRVESRDEIFVVKGADLRMVEILRLTDDDVRLAYDATDGRYPRAWRLDVVGDGRSDALWCPNIGMVWERRHEFRSARLIRRSDAGPSTSEPFPYLVGIQAHGRHIDYGGDVGVVDAVLVTRFEPHVSKTADGYHELHHWAIVNGRAIGLVRYEEIRNNKVARSFTFNRYVPSRSVPLSSLIVHPVTDPPPTLDPEPDPMPTIPEPIITDPEAANMGARIEHHYDRYAEQVGYAKREVHTNPLSYVWGIRYYQERQRGIGHEPAIQAVERAMAQAVGMGEPMPDPPPPDPDPLPDPGPSQVLPVVVDGRILRTTDGAALDWREASFFMVLARWLGQNGGSPAQMVEAFTAWRRKGINTLRGFVSIGHPNFWQSRGWLLTPRTPGIYKALHDCTVAAAAEGIRMRWTLLADTGDVFRDGADVRAHVVACMDALRGLPCVIEICNEPTMNGYGSGWAQELADLGRSLDESAVIALGPEHGATGHLATADIPPADVVFFHAERVLNEGGWAWVRRLGEYGVVKDGRRPVISGEPVNAGDEGAPGDYLRDPAVWFAYGAISRLVVSHGYAPTFHYHDGLFAEMPNEATDRCLQAFIAGCDVVPLDVRGWAWTNGHHAEAPWRGYDQTDPPSDNRPVRIYGRRSGGTYWGVSLREPKGWSWSDLRYPVERVARAEGERFDCSVWRGRP